MGIPTIPKRFQGLNIKCVQQILRGMSPFKVWFAAAPSARISCWDKSRSEEGQARDHFDHPPRVCFGVGNCFLPWIQRKGCRGNALKARSKGPISGDPGGHEEGPLERQQSETVHEPFLPLRDTLVQTLVAMEEGLLKHQDSHLCQSFGLESHPYVGT